MKAKKKKSIFMVQLTEESLKVIKCLPEMGSLKVLDVESETIPKEAEDKKVTERLSQILDKLGYHDNPVIISLPRNLATLRFLKVPSQIPQEIERIVSLQAATYLPYPAGELITGYQTILIDKEGYSHLNLIIVHQDAVKRQLNFFQGVDIKNITLALSSYGMLNLYNYLKPEDPGSVMLVDIDLNQAELAIVSGQRLLFSRYLKLNLSENARREDLLIEEIKKTRDVYLKDVSKENLVKIIVMDTEKKLKEDWQIINKQMGLPVENLNYLEKIGCLEDAYKSILDSKYSFTSLIGLGLKEVPEPLNLLPKQLKERAKAIVRRKEYLRLTLSFFIIVLLSALAIAKHLDNKAKYLKQLKIELEKIANEAKPLEEIDKRFKFMEARLQKKPSTLDIVSELLKIIPNEISLVSLSYAEDNQLILRGQSPNLNSIFTFVSQLEKSKVFQGFSPKIRYATQKKTQAGEIIDFEITGAKK